MAKKLALSDELWQRVKQFASAAGYSSPEELVQHAVEKELARLEESDGKREVEQRLKGLGYLK